MIGQFAALLFSAQEEAAGLTNKRSTSQLVLLLLLYDSQYKSMQILKLEPRDCMRLGRDCLICCEAFGRALVVFDDEDNS